MKAIIALVCVLLVLTYSNASARIGETFSQCKSRYGQPISSALGSQGASYTLRQTKDGWVLFSHKDVYIYVKCYNDKRVGRILYDARRASSVNPKDFLALNSGGIEWVAVKGKPYNFETQDGRLRANLSGLTLEIWTAASETEEQAAKDAQTKKRLEGF